MKSPEEIVLESILNNSKLCRIVAFLMDKNRATTADIHTNISEVNKINEKMRLLLKKGIVAEEGGLYCLTPLIALEATKYSQFKRELLPIPPNTKY